MEKLAIGIIDVQAGFMPASEGKRLGLPGFGELPVPEGEQVIAPLDRLLGAFALHRYGIFTTQDWHPHTTAHFSETPNFTTNWPVHCVAGTPGAELHPDLVLPGAHERFTKGFEPLERGEDDLSYSGYYAEDPVTGKKLPEWLGDHGYTKVVLGGLALDYCVGKTALDLRTKLGLDVIVAIDATRGIAEPSVQDMLSQFKQTGIEVATTDELLANLPIAA
jgi:nicotinamidase/pyrazinamidase